MVGIQDNTETALLETFKSKFNNYSIDVKYLVSLATDGNTNLIGLIEEISLVSEVT